MKIVADTNIPFVKECFSSIGDVTVIPGRDMLPEIVADADALLVRSVTKVNEQLLSGGKVKFVATATIGFEHIDTDYLTANNIGFASAPGSNANSVAEYIIAAILEIAHKHNIELQGKTIGIVGVGNVGGRVEAKCRAIGMIPVLNDPPLQRQTGDEKYRPIDEIYGCDFITLHTPLNYEGRDKTYHLADTGFFNSLKNGAVFVNSSRGAVVDTTALKQAVKNNNIQSAVLDVWENEPDIDIELLQMVDIGSPHIAGYSYDGKMAGMIMIYESLCKHFSIEPVKKTEDFLPEPLLPRITIETLGSEQEILRKAVQQVYNIKADDENLRGILKLCHDDRLKTFDRLRKEYPIRREFQNTKVLSAAEELKTILQEIGFKIG